MRGVGGWRRLVGWGLLCCLYGVRLLGAGVLCGGCVLARREVVVLGLLFLLLAADQLGQLANALL